MNERLSLEDLRALRAAIALTARPGSGVFWPGLVRPGVARADGGSFDYLPHVLLPLLDELIDFRGREQAGPSGQAAGEER
jgi:hypothetical protein